MKILVTGGLGFIGQHVVTESIARGHEVVTLSRRSPRDPTSSPAPVLVHDLRSSQGLAAELRGVDVVVHCAAAMGGDLAAQTATTVDGTRNLLHAMTEAGVSRIIGVGTFACYDYRALAEDALLDESAPLDVDFSARAPYVEAKHHQEALIQHWAEDGGRGATLLRPGLVFGPGRTWFHHLGTQVSPSRWLVFAPGSTLPLVHVESCAEACALAAEGPDADGQVLNLVDSELPSRGEYVDWLAAVTNPRPSLHRVSWTTLRRAADHISAAAGPLGLRSRLPDLLRPAALAARSKPLRYTNDRAREVLGWVPRWTPREGLARSVDPA